MGREPNTRPVQVLYIGRVDATHQKLWDQLQREGIGIVFALTQKAGLEKAEALQPQVVVVNAMSAQFTADRICRLLARRLPNARRLVMSDHAHDEAACDQRLVFPFTVQKLRKSLLKLLESSAPQLVAAGPLTLDILGKTVQGPLGVHHLTPKQCHLLAAFMERPNQVISRKDLMDQIWETAYLGDTRTLDVHIRWLREKIELDPKRPALLVTKRGVGYVLAVAPEGNPNGDGASEQEEVLELD